MRARLRVLAVLLSTLGCVVALFVAPSATARNGTPVPIGSDKFIPKRGYSGDFPDPMILRVKRNYYAYATTVAALNLPVMTSRDLVNWKARKKSGRKTNDAMPRVPGWAEQQRAGKRWFANTWAPSVAKIGKRYVAAYSVPLAGQTVLPGQIKKYCISLAYSRNPLGPFKDTSAAPLVCPTDRGAIDPDISIDPAGQPYLYWKTEQAPGLGIRSQIYGQALNANATGFWPGSTPSLLLETQDAWEGILIENPSMINYGGRYYLFYSGGSYANPTYATGYAICQSQIGPCTRASNSPLLTSGGGLDGPGGGSAFVDHLGSLRLAYAAWNEGNYGYPKTPACLGTAVGCAQRRLHVATLIVQSDGTLGVAARG